MKEDNKEVENKNVENAQEKNSIQISDDVIAVIAGMAVAEVPGVADMAGGFAGGISEVLSGKKNMAKGIKVDVLGEEVKIDVNIIVDYGTRIPDVAFEIQKRVKKSIENMTGLKATEVNVHVQGVLTEQDKKETKVEEKKESKKDNNDDVKKTETKKTTEKK